MKKKLVIIGVIIFVLLCCGIAYFLLEAAASFDGYQIKLAEAEFYRFSGITKFDVDTIISDINSQNYDLFENIDKENVDDQKSAYNFPEKDYQNIIFAFFEQFWKADMDDWKLIEISYRIDNCNENLFSLDGVIYRYTRSMVIDHQNVIITRSIHIVPSKGLIYWEEKGEHLDGMDKAINADKVALHLDDVFKISSVNCYKSDFQCDDSTIRMTGYDFPYWQVIYYAEPIGSYRCEVNAITGRVKMEK